MEEADFVFLQSQTGMTGGNLSSLVKKLDQAGYVLMRKEFQESKPRTSFSLTDAGRTAFTNYLRSMRDLLAVFDGLDPTS